MLARARRADIVVVHRNAALAGPPLAEALLTWLGRPLVYDFDDAVYMAPEVGDTPLRRLLRCDWRVAFICRRAALVGAGNPFLAAWARRHAPRVTLWPSTVDTGLYRPAPPREGDALPVIGWTGSHSTATYLEDILPGLAALQRRRAFELLVVGAELDLAAHGIRGRCAPWSAEREVELIRAIDIGLMPLRDTPWARGKCGLKAIQYQALGIPAVVSDVGVNREVVRHGETGFLVPPGGDWGPPLERLLDDPALRLRMGRAGRAHVEAHYGAQVVAARVAGDLAALLGGGPERSAATPGAE